MCYRVRSSDVLVRKVISSFFLFYVPGGVHQLEADDDGVERRVVGARPDADRRRRVAPAGRAAPSQQLQRPGGGPPAPNLHQGPLSLFQSSFGPIYGFESAWLFISLIKTDSVGFTDFRGLLNVFL